MPTTFIRLSHKTGIEVIGSVVRTTLHKHSKGEQMSPTNARNVPGPLKFGAGQSVGHPLYFVVFLDADYIF